MIAGPRVRPCEERASRRASSSARSGVFGAYDRTGSLTTIRIDEPNVADTTDNAAQLSPVLSQRRWEQEAEANVLERLEAIGLLAPAGELVSEELPDKRVRLRVEGFHDAHPLWCRRLTGYYLTLAPDADARVYQQTFVRIGQSLRLTDVRR